MKNQPVAYLNSNDGTGILAFGESDRFTIHSHSDLNELQRYIEDNTGSYLFGFLSYDLKEQLHNQPSNNQDCLNFPHAFFWKPKYVVKLFKEHVEFLQGEKNQQSLDFVNDFLEEETDQNYHHNDYHFQARITKEEYLQKVNELKHQIQLGNIYEINFCQEFFAEDVVINYSFDTYFKLNQITQAPFSSYLQFDEFAVYCGSPERFLSKKGKQLISQPIKGTAPRSTIKSQDELNKEQLASDGKERSENVMIVDLVRNDLSRIATPNSVKVDELCGIYSFETVHQMISTISCEIKPEVNFVDILKATFPMGSMTGAPKLKAMELIEQYESFRRGLYSGSIGYISPNGDFEFNVVIRTLLYNQKERYLSCAVGSAITIQSQPEKEYEECMLKVGKIMEGMNA
jgi:para-aminobenzoate synthetase component 1